MPGFTYFLPDHPLQTVDLKAIRDANLEYIIGDKGVHACQKALDGPDDKHSPGVLFTMGEANLPGAMLEREKQVWRKVPGSTAWVGVYKDSLPGPDDLVRSKVIGNTTVTLADGNEWRVPRAMAFRDGQPTHSGEFPQSVEFDDSGEPSFRLLSKYEPLCTAAWGYFEHFFGIDGVDWTEIADAVERQAQRKRLYAGFYKLATQALAVNYRVGPAELSLLGALTTDNVRDILRVLIDADAIEEWVELKKKEQESKGEDAPSFPASGAAPSPGDASRGSAADSDSAPATATGASSSITGG